MDAKVYLWYVILPNGKGEYKSGTLTDAQGWREQGFKVTLVNGGS